MGTDWGVMSRDATGATRVIRAPFVFVGAGGNALPLLQKSGIEEIRGFGGFPISGQWLRCTDPEIIDRHQAKVYGKAAVGAPPMSVPHLDTRVVRGQRSLMFGPYAGWSRSSSRPAPTRTSSPPSSPTTSPRCWPWPRRTWTS